MMAEAPPSLNTQRASSDGFCILITPLTISAPVFDVCLSTTRKEGSGKESHAGFSIFVNESAQHVLSAYVQGHQVSGRWRCAPGRRSKADPSMRPLLVVMVDVGPKDAFKVPSAEDDRPVKAFGPKRPPYGVHG
jgi:hypothetical protein